MSHSSVSEAIDDSTCWTVGDCFRIVGDCFRTVGGCWWLFALTIYQNFERITHTSIFYPDEMSIVPSSFVIGENYDFVKFLPMDLARD